MSDKILDMKVKTSKIKVLANLDRLTYERLAGLSRRTGNPMTFYIRQALDEYLNRQALLETSPNLREDPLNALVGALDHGPRDLSENIDRHLYGA